MTLENCRIASPPQSWGLHFEDVPGRITLRNNTIDATAPGLPSCLTVINSRVLLENSTVGIADIVALAVSGRDGGTGLVHAFGNTFQGAVIVGENSFLRSEGNSFTSGLQILDSNLSGGFINDPVAANGGVDPEDVFSAVDFDGDGCADYPPPQTDEEGNCIRDGVSPPADPGLP